MSPTLHMKHDWVDRIIFHIDSLYSTSFWIDREYRQMISDITAALHNLTKMVPSCDPKMGYELEGFIWFQGWNDMISLPKVQEYEFNLANLIRDVRADLDAPAMTFIVGGMGQRGVNTTGRWVCFLHLFFLCWLALTRYFVPFFHAKFCRGASRYYAMQRAEKAVTLYDEFRNNTLFVPTAQFMNYPGNDTYNGEYHYDGRADVYTHIGRAFGHGMLKLMRMKLGNDESKETLDNRCSSNRMRIDVAA